MLVTLSAGCQTPLSLLRQRETTNTPFDVSQGDQHIPLFGGNDALRQSFAHLLQGGELLIGQRFQTKRSYTEKYAPSGGGASGNARSRSSNINVFHPPWFVPCHSEIRSCRRKITWSLIMQWYAPAVVPSLGEKWPARERSPNMLLTRYRGRLQTAPMAGPNEPIVRLWRT